MTPDSIRAWCDEAAKAATPNDIASRLNDALWRLRTAADIIERKGVVPTSLLGFGGQPHPVYAWYEDGSYELVKQGWTPQAGRACWLKLETGPAPTPCEYRSPAKVILLSAEIEAASATCQSETPGAS